MERALERNNNEFINYYLKTYNNEDDYKLKFLNKFLLYELDFYSVDNWGLEKKNLKKSLPNMSPILIKIYKKLCSIYGKNKTIDYIITCNVTELSSTLLSSVIRFKCIDILEDIINIKGSGIFSESINYQVLEDLFKYGQYSVVKYLVELIETERIDNFLKINTIFIHMYPLHYLILMIGLLKLFLKTLIII